MSENRIIRAAFLISFTGHFLLLGASGFNLRLPYQEKKPDEITVNLEVERPALLPKIDTIGEEKKIKEVKERPKQKGTKQQPQTKEAAIQDITKKRPEERIKVINPKEEAMLRYQDMVKQKIEEARKYPLWAKKQGIEGIACLNFTVLSNGLSRDIKLIRSSGSGILDEEAAATIIRAEAFPPIPKEINSSSVRMEVAIVFTLN